MTTSIFSQKKSKILGQLSVPDTEYADASPKGSVDAGIRHLIDEINALEGVVTTSSCAGRVSVYLEGHKKTKGKSAGRGEDGNRNEEADAGGERVGEQNSSTAGGKGGGEWLFVSHDPLPVSLSLGTGVEAASWSGLFGLEDSKDENTVGEVVRGPSGHEDGVSSQPRLIHFKFEPMILHVLTASHQLAQLLVQAGMEAGFRETGAVSLLARHQSNEDTATPVVAVRSMGLSFESLIGIETADGRRRSIVSPEYLELLVQISHERFAENQKRISRFQVALKAVFAHPGEKKKAVPEGWEDSETRRERKKQEGLRRRNELKQKEQETFPLETTDQELQGVDLVLEAPYIL